MIRFRLQSKSQKGEEAVYEIPHGIYYLLKGLDEEPPKNYNEQLERYEDEHIYPIKDELEALSIFFDDATRKKLSFSKGALLKEIERENPGIITELVLYLEEFYLNYKREDAENFVIHFASSMPGEPGGGAPDSDFYIEFLFRGTIEEAVKEAKQIAFETYQGDYGWWITKRKDNKILASGCL